MWKCIFLNCLNRRIILVTNFGISIDSKLEQKAKANSPIEWIEDSFENITDFNLSHTKNAFSSILVTDFGITIDSKLLHKENAFGPIIKREDSFESITDFNFVQLENAFL